MGHFYVVFVKYPEPGDFSGGFVLFQFSLNVEQDVGFGFQDGLAVGRQHRGVVEMEPMGVLDHKSRVVSRPRPVRKVQASGSINEFNPGLVTNSIIFC